MWIFQVEIGIKQEAHFYKLILYHIGNSSHLHKDTILRNLLEYSYCRNL